MPANVRRGRCRGCGVDIKPYREMCSTCGVKRQAQRGLEKRVEEMDGHWLKGWR